MRYQRGRTRRGGFANNALHHGREFLRRSDAFVRQFGPALNIGAMSRAPALASAGLPQAAATTAVCGSGNRWIFAAQIPAA